MRRSIEASLDEALADEPPLHARELALVRLAVQRLPPREQISTRRLGELALAKCVLAAVLGLRDEIEPFGDLALGVPELGPELGRPGKGMRARVLLEHRTLARSGHVAGARVENRGVPQGLRERDEVLGAERVRVERLVERRVEVHDACHIDDGVDGSLELANEPLLQTTERAAHVAVDGLHPLAKEGLVALATAFAQRGQRLARRHVAPEAALRRRPVLRADDEEDLANTRVAVEEHRPEHLAEKARPSEDDEACPVDDAGDVQRLVPLLHASGLAGTPEKTLRLHPLTVMVGRVSRMGGAVLHSRNRRRKTAHAHGQASEHSRVPLWPVESVQEQASEQHLSV